MLSVSAEMDETIKRISSRKGVKGIIIMNHQGQTIRTTMEADEAKLYAHQFSHLVKQTQTTNDLTFLRIRTKKYEVMIAPHEDYVLLVVQNPSETYQEQ
ncbi:roadblock [Hesseltinella vesiculosa]|uniref:Dynein light chain roadblock n=1 Tax=Hesseltinella vesiculosa TaxID=101127 RepID=A0A1X2GHK9_9FUNG|nr:roadblock [Hesseltinella vesiculosa]